MLLFFSCSLRSLSIYKMIIDVFSRAAAVTPLLELPCSHILFSSILKSFCAKTTWFAHKILYESLVQITFSSISSCKLNYLFFKTCSQERYRSLIRRIHIGTSLYICHAIITSILCSKTFKRKKNKWGLPPLKQLHNSGKSATLNTLQNDLKWLLLHSWFSNFFRGGPPDPTTSGTHEKKNAYLL